MLKNLPKKSRQLVAYTPSLFIVVALSKIQKKVPRIGMLLLIISMVSLAAFFVNEYMVTDKDQKLFIDKKDKIFFLLQIAVLLGLSTYILDSVIPVTNLYKSALAK